MGFYGLSSREAYKVGEIMVNEKISCEKALEKVWSEKNKDKNND